MGLSGRVMFVSSDRTSDPSTGRAWFGVSSEDQRESLPRDGSGPPLQPGMPAEVYVITAERTLIECLAEPLGLLIERAMREQ